MPNFLLPAGAGLAQGFTSGLFRGLEMQERRQDSQRRAELAGIEMFTTAAKLPRSMRGPYLEYLSDIFPRVTGRPFNPTLKGMMLKADDETMRSMSEAITSAGQEPGKVLPFLQAFGEENPLQAMRLFSDLQAEHAGRQRQQAYQQLVAPLPETEEVDVGKFKVWSPEMRVAEAERRYRMAAGLPGITGPQLEPLQRAVTEERVRAAGQQFQARVGQLMQEQRARGEEPDWRTAGQQAALDVFTSKGLPIPQHLESFLPKPEPAQSDVGKLLADRERLLRRGAREGSPGIQAIDRKLAALGRESERVKHDVFTDPQNNRVVVGLDAVSGKVLYRVTIGKTREQLGEFRHQLGLRSVGKDVPRADVQSLTPQEAKTLLGSLSWEERLAQMIHDLERGGQSAPTPAPRPTPAPAPPPAASAPGGLSPQGQDLLRKYGGS